MRQRIVRALESIWYGGHRAALLLAPLEALYRLVTAARRGAYRRGWKESAQLRVPVVVVGNLSVGGTGKTPCVIWLATELARRGRRPGIVSRGYRGAARDWPRRVTPATDPREVGDEPVLMARRTGCPVVAGPDRVAAARHLLQHAPDVDVLLSDDGLQHYRLARCCELAVVDGERGLGNGRCLPAGPLREPPARLEEVDAVVVNGGSWELPGAVRAELVPTRVARVTGQPEERALEDFAGRKVHAVAGIGHPERFFRLLEDAGARVLRHSLPDHAVIDERDVRFGDGAAVLMTEKDAVKCHALAHDDLWYVAVELRFAPDDAARLVQLVESKLEPKGPA